MKRIVAFLLCIAMFFTGCNRQSRDLTENITPREIENIEYSPDSEKGVMDFSARLFAARRKDGENTLISPVSMLNVLGMIANGADGQTLEQLEKAFGCTYNDLNNYLYRYNGKAKNITYANSLWVRDGFTPGRQFLQTNADYYGAGVFTRPFDNNTVKEINDYVKQNTNGMIDKIIDRLNPSTVLCLINALTFEDEWQNKYEKRNIRTDVFNAYDGSKQDVDFMFSSESGYIGDENTTGFVKHYKNGSRFVALLPEENTDINDYIKSLDGEKLAGLLASMNYAQVDVWMPAFESEFSDSMIETMEEMGVTDLFDGKVSNLSKMSEGDTGLYISRLLHKTYIKVDPKGTKAAAISFATADESAAADPFIIFFVKLDRPFVYMILPPDSDVPLFIGSVLTVE